jgi:hypothetical protein
MGCGCGGAKRTASTWKVTAPAGQTFPDGEREKTYATETEANAAVAAMPGASKERFNQ